MNVFFLVALLLGCAVFRSAPAQASLPAPAESAASPATNGITLEMVEQQLQVASNLVSQAETTQTNAIQMYLQARNQLHVGTAQMEEE